MKRPEPKERRCGCSSCGFLLIAVGGLSRERVETKESRSWRYLSEKKTGLALRNSSALIEGNNLKKISTLPLHNNLSLLPSVGVLEGIRVGREMEV